MNQTQYLERLPPAMRTPGDHRRGEIELLSGDDDPQYGIQYQDPYVMLIRDKVRFPDASVGSYLRIANTCELSGYAGTVMIPVWCDSIYLVRIFRHATRRWEWELPRGYGTPGISEEQNARKEIEEELGIQPERVRRIGEFNANTGLLTGMIGVYAVELSADPAIHGRPQLAESIEGFKTVAAHALPAWLSTGELRCGISLAALALYLATRVIHSHTLAD